MTKRILNVVTNVAHYDDPAHATGLWLSELTWNGDTPVVQPPLAHNPVTP